MEVKSDPSKAAPRKTSIPASNGTLPSSDADVASKNESTNQVKASSSGSDKHPVLSPSRLKDQAEIHARLQKAVKQQVEIVLYFWSFDVLYWDTLKQNEYHSENSVHNRY